MAVTVLSSVVMGRAGWSSPEAGACLCSHSPQVLFLLNCKVDSHGHDDDDDPHDDEGDAEHPGQAAQPAGPVQVPLLHTTSRHDGKDEGDEVEGPDRAEAGDDGKDEVIFGNFSILGIGGGGNGGRPPRAGPGG